MFQICFSNNIETEMCKKCYIETEMLHWNRNV